MPTRPHPITPAMRARWVEERCRLDGDPTPAEIRERCLEVQAGWDATTELSRRSVRWVAITDGRGGREAVVPARNPTPGAESTTARRRNGGPMAR